MVSGCFHLEKTVWRFTQINEGVAGANTVEDCGYR
jgi:hypothetical protein